MTWSVAARLFHSIPRPWLNPNWEESWLARTSWVSGFFSSRGKPLVLWRGAGVCPPRKKEGGLPEPLTGACGQPERELLAWPLVVSGKWCLGSAVFPHAHICFEGKRSPVPENSLPREGSWTSPREKPNPQGEAGNDETKKKNGKTLKNVRKKCAAT